jgi:hypothetical protein
MQEPLIILNKFFQNLPLSMPVLALIVIKRIRDRDNIALGQPAIQINILTALAAKGPKFSLGLFMTDRAFFVCLWPEFFALE